MRKKYYKFTIVALFFLAIFLAIAAFLFLFSHKPALAPESSGGCKVEKIKINGNIINVEIADTVEKQEKGLSGRAALSEDQGMLFIFEYPDHYSFWMKDMNFSLDFIWMKGNEIIEITENVKPEDCEPPESLVPKNKVDKVLEASAGTAERLGIKAGDRLEF